MPSGTGLGNISGLLPPLRRGRLGPRSSGESRPLGGSRKPLGGSINERRGLFAAGRLFCRVWRVRGVAGLFYNLGDLEGGAMSEAFILPGRGEKQPEKGWRWLWQSSFGRGIQRFFAVQSRSDEQGRDASRVYIRQHPSEAGLYSFAELLKEGRLLTSEELAQIESRCRGVAKTLLWHDGVPLDDLSDMGVLCVWDVPRLMGMVRELSRVKHDAQGGMP